MVGVEVEVEVVVEAVVEADLVVGVLCAGNKDTHFRTNLFSCFMSLMYLSELYHSYIPNCPVMFNFHDKTEIS